MLLKTSRLNITGHYHIAYLPMGEDGQPLRPESQTTKNKGHIHGLIYSPPMPAMDEIGQPIVDEMGQPVMATEGGWQILPAEDGHTHVIEGEVERREEKPKDDEQTRVKKVRDKWKFASEYEADSLEMARESEKFANGEQWEEADRKLLESQAKACLTIPLVPAMIDVLCGYQRQNRTDIKLVPVEEGDAKAADIFTAVVKNVCEQNEYAYVETTAFEDACVVGRGLIHSYIDTDSNLQGDVRLENMPWDDVRFGPHDKLDLSDCEYLIKGKWYSHEKIKQLWPEKADEIQAETEYWMMEEGEKHFRVEGDQYNPENNPSQSAFLAPDTEFVDSTKKEYRVLEMEKRHYVRVPVLYNAEDDFYYNADGWPGSDVNAVKTIPGFSLVHRKVSKMEYVTVAGSTLLDSSISEDEEEFSVIPVYAKKRKNRFYGKVELAKDAQREVNKRHSQAVDIVNKMAAYGWFTFPGTFPNAHEKRKFEQNSSTPGFVIEVSGQDKMPMKQEGVKVPAELVSLEENAVAKLREVMHVNPELMGQGAARSGIALIEQKKQGLLGNEYLYDNLNFAKKQLGKRLVRLIQKTYTPDRILRILENRNQRVPVQVGGQPMDKYPREELVALLENADITKFDLVVSESAHSPTQMMATFAVLLESAQAGIPVPPQMMIEAAPMIPQDKKEQMLKALEAQQQAQAQAEQAKNQTEMVKSMPDQIKVQEFMRMQGQGQPPTVGGPMA